MNKYYTPYTAEIPYRGRTYRFAFEIVNRGLWGFRAYIKRMPSYESRERSNAATWRSGSISPYIWWDKLIYNISEMKAIIALWTRATVMYIADGGRMSDHVKRLCLAEKRSERQQERVISRKPQNTVPHTAARVDLSAEAFQQILAALGTVRPEQGGALGMDENGVITHFFHDRTAFRTGGTYTPDNKQITRLIDIWEEENVHFCGMIHSHPGNMNYPSSPDVEYAKRILKAMPNTLKGVMHMPIVTVNLFQRTASLNWYIVTEAYGLERAALYVDGKLVNGFVSIVQHKAPELPQPEAPTDIRESESENPMLPEAVFMLTVELPTSIVLQKN